MTTTTLVTPSADTPVARIHNIGGNPGYTWGIMVGDTVKRYGLCLAECGAALKDVQSELAAS